MRKPATFSALLILLIIAIAHAMRMLVGLEIRVSGYELPVWASAPPAFVLGVLAILGLRERRRH